MSEKKVWSIMNEMKPVSMNTIVGINSNTTDFSSEGQDIELEVAKEEFITNGIDEAIKSNVNNPTVWARIIKGEEFTFLEDGIRYFLCADNGTGITNPTRLFQNGKPDGTDHNHKYNKGLIRAWSKLWPKDNGRIMVFSQTEEGWECYYGSYGDIKGPRTYSFDQIELRRDWKCVFITAIYENSEYILNHYVQDINAEASALITNVDETDVNMVAELSRKYQFYLTKYPELSIFYGENEKKITPPIFLKDEDDGIREWKRDFTNWGFRLEITRYKAPRKTTQTFSGGIFLADYDLIIQDMPFSIIPTKTVAKPFTDMLTKYMNGKNEIEDQMKALEAFNVEYAEKLSEKFTKKEFKGIPCRSNLNRYRYCVNVIPLSPIFRLETLSTKTEFKYTPSLRRVKIAINELIGDEVRLAYSCTKESALRAQHDKITTNISNETGLFTYETEFRYHDKKEGVRIDGRITDLDGVVKLDREFKRGVITGANASQLVSYHCIDSIELLNAFPEMIRGENSNYHPGLSIHLPNMSLYGTNINEEAIEILKAHRQLMENTLELKFKEKLNDHNFKIQIYKINVDDITPDDDASSLGTLIMEI